ncbi:sorbitol dehydrogenase-like isoform X2 [Homarus americanus]|uniref:sorbitol dehydrogenase-like isoform X2 n=1 Tax=Homarus americanus TaxID=6706 RepID=UPI001C4894C7|nr:sorbitol dehydrogenase-like isoform X2 [Homarus americanus]
MATDNLSAVVYAKNDLRLENRPVPEPGPNEVLLRMAQVGICGSDVSYWTKGAIGHFVVLAPMVLGHESAGVVAKCGKNVTSLKPDITENRLRVAKEMGADYTILVDTNDAEKLAQQVKEVMGGMPDKTIECSGAETSVRLGILGTKSGGTIVLVGHGPDEVKIPVVNAAAREVDIRGLFRYANNYPAALDMVASGKINVKKLITHRFKLEEADKAFETARTGAGGAIKVMISCE